MEQFLYRNPGEKRRFWSQRKTMTNPEDSGDSPLSAFVLCVVPAWCAFMSVYLLIGAVAGMASVLWGAVLAEPWRAQGILTCRGCQSRRGWLQAVFSWSPSCGSCGRRFTAWPLLGGTVGAVLFAGFAWLVIELGCQDVSEVRPSIPHWQGRVPFHLLLLFFLLTAIVTDLIDYVIPEQITNTGTLIAVALATLSGDLQLIHVWVDWSDELVRIYGPGLPQWMKDHQHLHGLVWSVCGLMTGGGLTWVTRAAANRILGFPAIGFGDVTLMAMIGAWIGWQPVLCVLAVGPLAGILTGTLIYVVTGRSYLAFGPPLCVGTMIVLCCWRAIWEEQGLRIIFCHPPTLAGLIGGAYLLFCILLYGVRVFRGTSAQQLRR